MKLCPRCHTGKLEMKKVIYVQWQDPNLVIVDRIPAMVCDNCGEKTYDLQALENLQQLLWTTLTPPPRSPMRPSSQAGKR